MRTRVLEVKSLVLSNKLYYSGTLNMLVGRGGLGKSVISMNIARQLVGEKLAKNIVYIDSDSKGAAESVIFNNYAKENGYLYYDVSLLLEEESNPKIITNKDMVLDILENDVEVDDVVILDALINIVDDINDNKELTVFMQKLRHLTKTKKITMILIHHSRKSDNEYLGATAIQTNCSLIHSLYSVESKGSKALKLKVVKDNKNKVHTNFDVLITEDHDIPEEPHTFNLNVEYTPSTEDKYEGMSKVEIRQAVKEERLLKYIIAMTIHPTFKPIPATDFRLKVSRHINQVSEDRFLKPTDNEYIGGTFINKHISSLIDSYLDYEHKPREDGRGYQKYILTTPKYKVSQFDFKDLDEIFIKVD
jgi:archaellum biogenesis ATPase FlaH